MIFPQIDLFITSFFYENNHFFIAEQNISKFIMYFAYKYAPLLPIIFIFMIFLLLIKNIILYVLNKNKKNITDIQPATKNSSLKKQTFFSNIRNKQYIFLILTLLIGPGLFVNSIVKEFSGRSRPRDIKTFNGKYNHTGPISFERNCKKNCSFVSGHASAGFYFISLSFLFLSGSLKRKMIFSFAFVYGSYISLTRIMIGAHFFSDILFAFAFVYLISKILYFYIIKNKNLKTSETNIA